MRKCVKAWYTLNVLPPTRILKNYFFLENIFFMKYLDSKKNKKTKSNTMCHWLNAREYNNIKLQIYDKLFNKYTYDLAKNLFFVI